MNKVVVLCRGKSLAGIDFLPDDVDLCIIVNRFGHELEIQEVDSYLKGKEIHHVVTRTPGESDLMVQRKHLIHRVTRLTLWESMGELSCKERVATPLKYAIVCTRLPMLKHPVHAGADINNAAAGLNPLRWPRIFPMTRCAISASPEYDHNMRRLRVC